MNLAGRLRLRPGAPGATLLGSRPLLVPRLARGRAADDWPGLVGSLFTLCSHAQRTTARRAVAAALGRPVLSSAEDRRALRLATAREQLLRIAHDWPRLLPGAQPDDAALRDCPLFQDRLAPAERLAALPGWLAERWLGRPLDHWLQAHEHDPAGWAQRWCAEARTPLAALLHTQAAPLQRLATPSRPLRLLDQPLATLPRLARQLAEDEGFCTAPDWLGLPAETGPWTRAVDPSPPALHNAWMRLIARLVDLLRLAAPDGGQRLAEGALPLGRGEAIAWTEMARGLLVHWVQLEDGPAGPRLAEARVLAPTDWNFHPQGVLARTLATLDGPDRAAQAARAAVAFDPCVEFSVEAAGLATAEPAHA